MIVTHASAIITAPPAASLPGPAGPLLDAARRALQETPSRVALRVAARERDGKKGGMALHRRRALKLLLQDAAQSGGGQVFETVEGELLLLGAAVTAAARAAEALARLGGTTPVLVESWQLPRDGEALLAWAAAARLPAPSPARPPAADLAGLDALLQALPPERVLRRRALLTLRRGASPSLAAQLLEFSLSLLAAGLGALAEDRDLLAHAVDGLAARLPGQLAGFGLAPGVRLLLPLARDARPGPAPRPGLVAVLNLAAAAEPARLAERQAELARDGWLLALTGLDIAALRLLVPAALPADLLLLRWSPALAQAESRLLAGLDPARLVLTGCDAPEALSWGAARGITCFGGAHVEALLAAMRLARCPAAADCGQKPCGERAAAITATGRAGCRNQALLAAMLPELPPP